MACATIKTLTFDLCKGNMGGILEIYFANVDDVSAITVGTAATLTDEGITGIEMSGTAKFQKFSVRKNTSSFTSTLNVSDGGGAYVSTVVSYIMPHMDAVKRAAMEAFMLSDSLCIVKDANKHYWLVGDTDNPLSNTAGTGETGVAKGDNNQYSIELTADTAHYPQEVDPDIIENITA